MQTRRYAYLWVGLLFCIPACFSKEQPTVASKESPTQAWVDLVDSTRIIQKLIVSNQLGTILEEHDPEELERLLHNVTPAQMALESEAINATMPVLVYYFDAGKENEKMLAWLKNFAETDKEKLKIVLVDAHALFILTQLADISELPTIILVQDGEEKERLVRSEITPASIENVVKNNIK